jgi:hypothetical protein
MTQAQLRKLIKTAFIDVKLEDGLSIRQGEVCDNYGEGVSDEEFHAIPLGEITDDWTALPLQELEQYPYLAYLDAKGFRYYIPAFLLSLLDNAQCGSMRVISTLMSLTPDSCTWSPNMDLLNDEQRSAIAVFLSEIQHLPQLDSSDQIMISDALEQYWSQFLPNPNN